MAHQKVILTYADCRNLERGPTGRVERGAWTPALFPGLVITLDALWGS